MRSIMWLSILAACGDNLAAPPGLDSTFDDPRSQFFGTVVGLQPIPGAGTLPVAGAEVCVDEICGSTNADGTFILVGGGAHESVFLVRAPGYLPSVYAVTGGPTGDRNLGSLLALLPTTIEDSAAAFHRDPMLASRGEVLVLARQFDTGAVELAIDGVVTSYLDDNQLPDPTRTTLSKAGGASFFAVAPGEATLRSTVGTCDANLDGWHGAAPGEIRIPVIVGHLTIVQPFCVGD
ncbi:MAG: hypothetical protein H6Q90_5486 [Deltaproteobacteria bacterium]|nr:hypothetical protein [Deltaproteobacteria bacterium]